MVIHATSARGGSKLAVAERSVVADAASLPESKFYASTDKVGK